MSLIGQRDGGVRDGSDSARNFIDCPENTLGGHRLGRCPKRCLSGRAGRILEDSLVIPIPDEVADDQQFPEIRC